MANRHKVADLAELDTEGARVIEEIDGIEIAVFRHDDGFYAIANYCVHQAGPLCEGHLSGATMTDEEELWRYENEAKNIVCPWHGWRFDIISGQNIDDDRYSVPTYGVEVDDDEVFVVK